MRPNGTSAVAPPSWFLGLGSDLPRHVPLTHRNVVITTAGELLHDGARG